MASTSSQSVHTKAHVVVAEDKAERKRAHLRVLVTSATSPTARTIASAVSQGVVFGYDQPLILHLYDVPGSMGGLEGLTLELLDSTYPLLRQVVMATVEESAFHDIDAAFLLYPNAEAPVGDSIRLFQSYGAALDKYAKKSVKVVCCGVNAAINAYACIRSAPSIDSRNITALSRLEHNQALAQIASKLAVAPNKVRNVVVWGGQGYVPDAHQATFFHRDTLLPVIETLKDESYLKGDFVDFVRNRALEVQAARAKYPSLSKSKAACDHMRDWWQGTPEGTWVSMGVVSNGAYGVPKGIVYSFPVHINADKEWEIVENIDLNPATKKRVDECTRNTVTLLQSAIPGVVA
ncbi:malate dehydrogenase, cytoplasmic-like [Haemaphysalis longicornis]